MVAFLCLLCFIQICAERYKTRSSSFLAKNISSKVERKCSTCWDVEWISGARGKAENLAFPLTVSALIFFFHKWCDTLFIVRVQQKAKSMLRNSGVSMFNTPHTYNTHALSHNGGVRLISSCEITCARTPTYYLLSYY